MSRLRTALVVLLAALANAGLIASATGDLEPFAAFALSDVWLLPGLVLLGALLALAIGDTARGAVALVPVALLGALFYGLAIAAPGFRVEGVRTTLIDRGTTYGLLALMLIALFGLAGVVVAWLLQSFLLPGGGSVGD